MTTTATSARCREQDVPASLAAIITDNSQQADQIIEAVIRQLQHQGYKLAGLRQVMSDDCHGRDGCGIQLKSIATGRYHRMTQDLGPGSMSCNIDSGAMAQLVETQRSELSETIDLVIVNRFGKRESEGAGFCGVFERALDLSIPALTIVKANWQTNWLEYGGEWVTTLAADEDEILAWCHCVIHSNPARARLALTH